MNYNDLAIIDSYAFQLLHAGMEREGLNVEVGDVVIPTEWARQSGLLRKVESGIVRGFGRNGRTIRVQSKGRKSINSYWAGFWRRQESSNHEGEGE